MNQAPTDPPTPLPQGNPVQRQAEEHCRQGNGKGTDTGRSHRNQCQRDGYRCIENERERLYVDILGRLSLLPSQFEPVDIFM
jgi:hypothetical protein